MYRVLIELLSKVARSGKEQECVELRPKFDRRDFREGWKEPRIGDTANSILHVGKETDLYQDETKDRERT